jgi:hypothetical protein
MLPNNEIPDRTLASHSPKTIQAKFWKMLYLSPQAGMAGEGMTVFVLITVDQP